MSIVSMTGFGRGSADKAGFAVEVELSSVNRKQLDVVLGLPRNLQILDSRIQDEIRKKLNRGRVTCSLTVSVSEAVAKIQGSKKLSVDHALAAQYLQELKLLSTELDVPFEPKAETFLRLQEVFTLSEVEVDTEACWRTVRTALRTAIDELVIMREHEGAVLLKDLQKRVRSLARMIEAISKRASHSTKAYKKNLMDRLSAAGLPVDLDDDRLRKEIAIFAEKSDFTEEIIRLQSHLEQFTVKLGKREAVGRSLDFLCQEIFREISTLGVKASDSAIGHKVVDFKSELEKLREQVQNVE